MIYLSNNRYHYTATLRNFGLHIFFVSGLHILVGLHA